MAIRRGNASPARGEPDALEEAALESRPNFGNGKIDNSGIEESERRWATNDTVFYGCGFTYEQLPPGLYKVEWANNIGYALHKQLVDTDELLILPDTASENIVNEIDKFWTFKAEFDARGFIHKRGILLWGDPGSGKTSTIQLIVKKMVDRGDVAIFAGDPDGTTTCLQTLRRIEPDRRIIVILEDLDAMIKEYGESELLAILDGESQVDNIVFVATTNYPEDLDKRFIDRPSRFDTVQEIHVPTSKARRMFFLAKEPSLAGDEIDVWVKLSKGFSIAHLKEMIVANRCYGTKIEDVVKRLKKMGKRDLNSENLRKRNKVGFGSDSNSDEPSTEEPDLDSSKIAATNSPS